MKIRGKALMQITTTLIISISIVLCGETNAEEPAVECLDSNIYKAKKEVCDLEKKNNQDHGACNEITKYIENRKGTPLYSDKMDDLMVSFVKKQISNMNGSTGEIFFLKKKLVLLNYTDGLTECLKLQQDIDQGKPQQSGTEPDK